MVDTNFPKTKTKKAEGGGRKVVLEGLKGSFRTKRRYRLPWKGLEWEQTSCLETGQPVTNFSLFMSAQLSESSSYSSWWAAWLLSQLPLTHCPPTLDLQGLPFKVPMGMLEAGALIKCLWEKTEVGGRGRQGGKIMEGRVRAIGKKEDWVMK